ncbi:MAG: 4-hydroxy-tetrahydrodipicolinate reductase [Chloroflexi bacterium]|nr:4-hydroxy-tetrahydrodipicolinate reductase [Chloroflexota bacterium]
MSAIRVVVNGVMGKMGQAVSAGLAATPGLAVVGGADIAAKQPKMAIAGVEVPAATSIEALLANVQADVLVDFSTAKATLPAVRAAAQRKVNFVVGTTGFDEAAVGEMRALAEKHGVGGMVAPNFALGAVLLMHLSQKAAPFFEYVEIIETHHETKIDAPSGTAAATARMIAQAKGKAFKRNVAEKETVANTRGGFIDGVTIHSSRLPGKMAHQEVIFGIEGQTLSLRHDQISRDAFVPGIAMAVRHVVAHKGFVFGLDKLMGLS